jgi:crotonobetainyl-CoA:carnitine CoA-transferase CaiB-like acyl-CoA transferase
VIGAPSSATVDGARSLDRVSVVSLGTNLPVAVAAARLSELGAAVTKIVPPGGDLLASESPDWYAHLTAGQALLTLDLRQSEGQRGLDTLLEDAEMLLTAIRPGALARLGLDWQVLSERFPTLLQVAIVGYPAPRQEVPGHDLTYIAHRGLAAPPLLPRTLVADLGGAERAVSTALWLLLGRTRGAYQRYAEVALSEAADFFAQPLRYGLTAERGVLGGGTPTYRFYRAQHGWIALAALECHFRDRLLTELGIATEDVSELAEAFLAARPEEWEAWASERDLPLVAVRDAPERSFPSSLIESADPRRPVEGEFSPDDGVSPAPPSESAD